MSAVNTPPDDLSLDASEVARYSRHLIMPEVGVEGQRRLKSASVLCVGAGGLGSPLALYLAAAGVGRLGLVDFDVVDLSNLHRQVIHGTDDVGRSKLASAADRIAEVNPHVAVEQHETRLTSQNALDILRSYDIVVDGTDNFPTRYLVNDACVLLGKPNVYGSIFRFEGQASVFWAERGPCYRCLYPEPPPPGMVPSCAEGGVLGVLPGLVGTIQATETVKLILERGEPLLGRILLIDAMAMSFRTLQLRKDKACPLCGENPTQTGLIDYEQFCGVTPAATDEPGAEDVAPLEVKARLDADEPFLLLDVRNPNEWDICRIEGARLIPLPELGEHLGELDRSQHIIAYCRTGVRSRKAITLLHQAGFTRLENLRGGIHAWADDVDPSIPKY